MCRGLEGVSWVLVVAKEKELVRAADADAGVVETIARRYRVFKDGRGDGRYESGGGRRGCGGRKQERRRLVVVKTSVGRGSVVAEPPTPPSNTFSLLETEKNFNDLTWKIAKYPLTCDEGLKL